VRNLQGRSKSLMIEIVDNYIFLCVSLQVFGVSLQLVLPPVLLYYRDLRRGQIFNGRDMMCHSILQSKEYLIFINSNEVLFVRTFTNFWMLLCTLGI